MNRLAITVARALVTAAAVIATDGASAGSQFQVAYLEADGAFSSRISVSTISLSVTQFVRGQLLLRWHTSFRSAN